MYYEVYIDQLFLENLVILVLLQKTCGKFLHSTVSWKRIWLTSVLGAAAVCAVIFFRLYGGGMTGWWVRILLLILTAAVGLGCRGKVEILRGTACLLTAGAVYCGTFQIIFSIWEPPVLLAAVLAYTAIDILINKRRECMVLEECRTEITLEDQGDRWKLTGLVDTGNHLTEPLTGRPVSILDWQEAEKMQRFRRIQQEENGYLYIPFHSVGTEKGWMMGMVVDAMCIKYQGEEIRISHPVLAVSREKLSPGDQYQMIVNPLHLH